MNTQSSDLARLGMLLESVCANLAEVARLKDSLRRGVINCAFSDVIRARNFWRDKRVEGMGDVLGGLASAATSLVEAAKTTAPTIRAKQADDAHKKLLSALGALKTYLAKGREEVATA